MSGPENTQPEEKLERTESVEERALQDATHEPGARVEATQAFEQAEAVEGALTEAMSTAETAAGAQPEVHGTPERPESQAQDPLTGKGYGGQRQEPGESSPTEEMAAPSGGGESQAGAVSTDKPVDQGEPVGVPPGEIDGNDPAYEMGGEEADVSGAISEGNDPLEGQTGGVDPQRIGKEKLGEELLTPQKGPGMKGPKGGGHKPGSVPKSGGGVLGVPYGGGMKGYHHPFDSEAGRWLSEESANQGSPGTYSEKDGAWVLEEEGWKWYPKDEDGVINMGDMGGLGGDTFDGDIGMPYTGSPSGGGDPDPEEPVGGLDPEAGVFSPVYGTGSGSEGSGGTPGDKDGDDDSGKFLADGELSGGGMVDPGDLDYNQANATGAQVEENAKNKTQQ